LANLEKAKIGDVPKIQQLVNSFADKGEMMARPLSEIYENLRDYFIIREDDKIIGCCALHVSWLDLAEIKALADLGPDKAVASLLDYESIPDHCCPSTLNSCCTTPMPTRKRTTAITFSSPSFWPICRME